MSLCLDGIIPQQEAEDETLSVSLLQMMEAIESRTQSYDASSNTPLYEHQANNAILLDWYSKLRNTVASRPASISETSFERPGHSPKTEPQQRSPYVFDFCSRALVGSWVSASTKIPQELFDDIIFYLDVDLLDNQPWYTDAREGGPVGKSLKTCSLVCRHWANRCRQRMFLNTTIKIRSPEAADLFIRYATHGCPALAPIHKMIRGIIVEQRYGVSRPFCHRFYIFNTPNTPTRQFLRKLELTGPIPPGFPFNTRDTPHWSLPCCIAIPPSLLPFKEITVRKLHLPSYTHVAKYVRHLTCAGDVYFDDLTWDPDVDADGQNLPAYIRRSNSPKFKGGASFFYASDCTDNFRVCFEIASKHQRSPMRNLGDDQCRFMILILRWLYDSFALSGAFNPLCSWTNLYTQQSELEQQILVWFRDRSDQNRERSLTFMLAHRESEDQQTSGRCIAGLRIGFGGGEEEEKDYGTNIDAFMTHLTYLSMLRAVVLSFWSHGLLIAVMRRYRPMQFNPGTDPRKFVLVFLRNKEDDRFSEVPRASHDADWVGIDPITLLPTGKSWLFSPGHGIPLSSLR